MSEILDVNRAGALLAAYLRRERVALLLRDDADGGVTYPVSPDTAGAPDGALPVFLVAADAVWEAASRRGFGLKIEADPDTFLGWRVTGTAPGTPFSVVMLSVIEAVEQARGPQALVVNDLVALPAQARRLADLEQAPAGLRAMPTPAARPS